MQCFAGAQTAGEKLGLPFAHAFGFGNVPAQEIVAFEQRRVETRT